MLELPPLILCVKCLFFFLMLPCCFLPTLCFQGYTAQALTEPLWRVLWLSWWGNCTQTKYPLVHSPCPKIHHSQHWWYPHPCQKSLVSGRPVMVQVECCSHYTSHENCVQEQQDVQTDAQANPPI